MGNNGTVVCLDGQSGDIQESLKTAREPMSTIETYRRRALNVEAMQFKDRMDYRAVWEDCNIQMELDMQTNVIVSLHVYNKLTDSWAKFELGDWIVQGSHGEYYPMKPESFLVSHTQDDVLPGSELHFAVQTEMDRQVELWGVQDHESAFGPAALYIDKTSDQWKELVDIATTRGELSWALIAIEEFAEALDEWDDPEAMREELIQLIAVLCSWVGNINQKLRAEEAS